MATSRTRSAFGASRWPTASVGTDTKEGLKGARSMPIVLHVRRGNMVALIRLPLPATTPATARATAMAHTGKGTFTLYFD